MRTRRRILAAAFLALGGAWLGAAPSHATSTPPMNVADLVRHSPTIVTGTVTTVNSIARPGELPYTEITLKVTESIRGGAGDTITFRQFGLQAPMPATAGRRFVGLVAGMPTYRVGEEVLLFLGPVSRIGLRTTAGLQQGKFVAHDGNFQNEVNNSGLFRDVPLAGRSLDDKEQAMVETKQGAVKAETFLGLVRRAVNGRWWETLAAPIDPRRRPIGPPSRKAPIAPVATGVGR